MAKTTDLPLVNVSEYRRGNQQSKEHEDPDGIDTHLKRHLDKVVHN
jgi:hypothetical protein